MKLSRSFISLVFVAVLVQPALLGLALSPSYNLHRATSTKLQQLPALDRLEDPFSLAHTLESVTTQSPEIPIEQHTPTRQTDDWTVMVYMCADNNLEEAGFDDFNAMETIGSTADVNIILGVDFSSTYTGAPFSDSRIYYIDYDTGAGIGSTELPGSWGSEQNFGDDSTLIYFINYAQTYAPADNYILVLWDHGGGWYGVCQDDLSGDIISMSELSTALGDASLEYIDVVAFDACLMGQIEVAYQVRSHCDYVVFSEESIPWEGYPYEEWLDELTTTPLMTPATLAQTLVDEYCTAYDTGIYSYVGADDVCLSAVQTSQLTGVSGALDTFTDALDTTSDATTHYSKLSYSIGSSHTFAYTWVIDLGAFASNAASQITDSTIAGYASNLAAAVTAAVAAEDHLSGAAGVTGLSIAVEDYGGYSLDLTTATHWDDFLDVFLPIGYSTATSLTPTTGNNYGFLEWTGDSVYYRFIPTATDIYTFSLSAMQDLGEDFDLFLYRGGTEIDSSETVDSTEQVSGTLTAGVTYYVRAYAYSYCGAFCLVFPGGGSTTNGWGFNPFGNPLMMLIIIAAIAVIVIIIIIVLIIVMVTRRRRTDYGGSSSSVRAVPSTGRVRCPHCSSIVPADSSFCPICGNKV
ncbi:MAG: clostripain-related cysteine peptidase [Promethearchaeota archaeon]